MADSTILETPRLLLRPWILEDAPAALAIWGDREVLRYLDASDFMADLAAARQALSRSMARHGQPGSRRWATVEKASKTVIAGFGFHPYEEPPGLEIVFHFARRAWGQGYATEAGRVAVRHAFQVMKTERLIGLTELGNSGSQRVLEKLGFLDRGLHPRYKEKLYELLPPGLVGADEDRR